MESTMMDFPLTVTAIMRYGTTVFGDKEVVTCAGDAAVAAADVRGRRRAGRPGWRTRCARSASTATSGSRTFMWNNAEHLEAYLAIPSMGAVLHTLNLRLSADQVGYIATHAGDYAVIVDASLIPLFAKVLPFAETDQARDRLRAGRRRRRSRRLAGPGREVHSYEELLAAAPASFDWPELDERSAAAMCYTSGTTGLPKGVVYSHRSSYLHSMAACTANGLGVSEHDRIMPIVPQFHANAWGLPYAALMSGRRPGDAGPVHDPGRHRQADRDREGDGRRGRARRSGRACSPTCGPPAATSPRCAPWSAAARRCRRR